MTDRDDRLLGFLLGSTAAGTALYYYVIDEYKVSNELLTEDIFVCLSLYLPLPDLSIQSPSAYLFSPFPSGSIPQLFISNHFSLLTRYPPLQALQSAVQRIEGYVKTLEEKVK